MKAMFQISEPLPILPTVFEVVEWRHIHTHTLAHENAPSPTATPFADLMLDKEKLDAVLKAAEAEQSANVTAMEDLQPRGGSMTKTTWGHRRCKSAGPERVELIPTEFHLSAPMAQSVQLAADFTDWEKSALNLIKTPEGIWFIMVPLSPGQYAYRFIVDGEWHDDPHCHQHARNPLDATNAVMRVQ